MSEYSYYEFQAIEQTRGPAAHTAEQSPDRTRLKESCRLTRLLHRFSCLAHASVRSSP